MVSAPSSVEPSLGQHLVRTLRALANRIGDDERDLAAAGLAFYLLLSIAPVFVVAIQVATAVFDPVKVQEALVEDLGRATGSQVSALLTELVQSQEGSSTATLLSTLLLLVAASRLFLRLQSALNMTWGIRADPQLKTREAIKEMLRKRAISFVMVLGSGAALTASLILKAVTALLTAPLHWIVNNQSLSILAVQLVEVVLSFVLLTTLLAAMYRFLPDVRIQWRDVWVGAVLTSVLLVLGMAGFSLYVATVGASQLAGAIGSIAVLMLWAYYTSHVLLLGALFTRIWADGPTLQPHAVSLSAGLLRDEPENGVSATSADTP